MFLASVDRDAEASESQLFIQENFDFSRQELLDIFYRKNFLWFWNFLKLSKMQKKIFEIFLNWI